MNPLVSIVIPTYNRAHLLGETLDSVIEQTYLNWECIIVDDGSTDNTEEVLQEYLKDARFQYHKRPKNRSKGANACRNYGFALSKGDWIKWFDSDDIMFNNLLQKQFSSIKYDDASICKIVKYNAEEEIALGTNLIQSKFLIRDYLVGKVAFYVSGPLWRREFLDKQDELFDESISNLDDWDFNLRMLYSKPNIVFIEEVLIKYRVHSNSLSHEITKLNKAEIDSEFFAIEKHIQLLKKNKVINYLILENYKKERYKFFLKKTLINSDSNKYYFFKKLLIEQFHSSDLLGFFKTVFGFSVYTFFNKGYKFLR